MAVGKCQKRIALKRIQAARDREKAALTARFPAERKAGRPRFCVAMPKNSFAHKAERPALASLAEAERQARAEKNARLRDLRTHTSWLVLDPDALFRDEIDCSALFGDAPMPKVTRR